MTTGAIRFSTISSSHSIPDFSGIRMSISTRSIPPLSRASRISPFCPASFNTKSMSADRKYVRTNLRNAGSSSQTRIFTGVFFLSSSIFFPPCLSPVSHLLFLLFYLHSSFGGSLHIINQYASISFTTRLKSSSSTGFFTYPLACKL